MKETKARRKAEKVKGTIETILRRISTGFLIIH
jgi:hypothetical protein